MSLNRIANDLLIFAQLQHTPSFTQCAEQLGITKASVSRSVSKLEAHFGLSLVARSPRGIHFTNAGKLVAASASEMANSLDKLEADIIEFLPGARGLLKVAAPAAIASLKLSPLLPVFSRNNPQVEIELDVIEHCLNPVTDQFDLILSWYPPQESNVYVKLLNRYPVVVAASPDYLNRYGYPESPAALEQHNCLHYKHYSGQKRWKFIIDGQEQSFNTSGRFTVATSTLLKEPLLAGQGIARLPRFIIEDQLQSGELVPLFEEYQLTPASLHAVYAHRSDNDPVVSKLLDFLTQNLAPQHLTS